MILNAMERLDLNDKLDELMIQARTASGLDLLDVNDQIDAILVKLGFGAAPAAATAAQDEAPSIVTDFLAGKFVKQVQADFVETLRQVGAYLDQFLTLDDMKTQANSWATEGEYAL